MLFTSAIGYLLVGMTLEYVSRSDILIFAIMALFGILKVIVRRIIDYIDLGRNRRHIQQ